MERKEYLFGKAVECLPKVGSNMYNDSPNLIYIGFEDLATETPLPDDIFSREYIYKFEKHNDSWEFIGCQVMEFKSENELANNEQSGNNLYINGKPFYNNDGSLPIK
jgi:hypothetical protein